MGNQINQPEKFLSDFHTFLAPKTGQKKYTLEEMFNKLHSAIRESDVMSNNPNTEKMFNILYFFIYYLQENVVPLGQLKTYQLNFYGKFEDIPLYAEFLLWYKKHNIFTILEAQLKRRTKLEAELRRKEKELKILKDNNDLLKANKKFEEINKLKEEINNMVDLSQKQKKIDMTMSQLKTTKFKKIPSKKPILRQGTKKEQEILLEYDNWINEYYNTEKSGKYKIEFLKKYLSDYERYFDDKELLERFLDYDNEDMPPHDYQRMEDFLHDYQIDKE